MLTRLFGIIGGVSLLFGLLIAATIPRDAFPTGSYANGDSTVAVLLVYLFGVLGIVGLGMFGWQLAHTRRSQVDN